MLELRTWSSDDERGAIRQSASMPCDIRVVEGNARAERVVVADRRRRDGVPGGACRPFESAQRAVRSVLDGAVDDHPDPVRLARRQRSEPRGWVGSRARQSPRELARGSPDECSHGRSGHARRSGATRQRAPPPAGCWLVSRSPPSTRHYPSRRECFAVPPIGQASIASSTRRRARARRRRCRHTAGPSSARWRRRCRVIRPRQLVAPLSTPTDDGFETYGT